MSPNLPIMPATAGSYRGVIIDQAYVASRRNRVPAIG